MLQEGIDTMVDNDGGQRRVLIGVDATKDPSDVCFDWALKNIVRSGDSVTFLGILHHIYTPMGYKSQADLSAFLGSNKRVLEAEIHKKMDLFEKKLQPLSDLCDRQNVFLDITITAGTPMKIVLVQEALKIRPTHIVLDRNLRRDKMYFKEHLHCNLVVFSQSNQVEHLQDSHDLHIHEKSLGPPQNLQPNRIQCSDRPTFAGVDKIIEGELVASTSSWGSELCQLMDHLSANSNSSENSFIDLYMINSSEGVVPMWSFGDAKENKSSSSHVYASNCDRPESESSRAALSPLPDTGHERNPVETPNTGDTSFYQSAEPRRLLPLLEEPLQCHEYQNIQDSDAMEADKKPAELQQSLSLNSDEVQRSENGVTVLLLDNTSEFVTQDADRQHDTHAFAFRSDNLNNLEETYCILGKNFCQPRPLCSVCKLKSPDFGKSPRLYRCDELREATNDFSADNLIAEGGFGCVYKGILQEGQIVAIKKLKTSSLQGDIQLSAEVEALIHAQHMNLVRLVGFCVDAHEHALVYEYVCNGSLDQHLSGENGCRLEWSSRYKIAIGAARGLRYLHEECRAGCIVHRDMRPSNILLTHDFTAMVGDFGLAKMSSNMDGSSETRVIGSLGYVAPEYIESSIVTSKTDVYSYGVVLLELITGRKAVDMQRCKGEIFLTEWARSKLNRHQIDELVDQRIVDSLDMQEFNRMVKAASLCIKKNPMNRPGISQILRLLEGDFDDVENEMSQDILPINSIFEPVFDNQDHEAEESLQGVDKFKMHQSSATEVSTGQWSWRNWVNKTK